MATSARPLRRGEVLALSLLGSYYLPGLYVEDFSCEVPLDWRGKSPAELAGIDEGEPSRLAAESAALEPDPLFAGEKIKLFWRTLCLPENVGRELPLIVFLQGGPGGCGPRVNDATTDGWIEEAVKHFRVVLPDQRGTGRSSRIEGSVMELLARRAPEVGRDPARLQADYLKRFLADSIVRDFEYLRLSEFSGARWVTLGQSYGGFLTLCNLSTFPAGVTAAFTCGGIPHVPIDAEETYRHTVPRMLAKTRAYYERYPEDEKRVAHIADLLAGGGLRLPDGSAFTVQRLQNCGMGLGMKPAYEQLHNLFDLAFCGGDGGLGTAAELSSGFLYKVMELTSTAANPLYWTLQEFIYADGTLPKPLRWAASRVIGETPELSSEARPLMFFGEASLPWMFEENPVLVPFAAAERQLMEDVDFGRLYDLDLLAKNEVPLQAAVYFDDLYVDSGLQMDTLSRIDRSHVWVSNAFEHDGLHGSLVFSHLFKEARDRGDLAELYCKDMQR